MDETGELFQQYKLPALIDQSIAMLRANEPPDAPYWGAFSGGKDSVVIKELARLSGVRVQWHYNVTTIDPPELVRFIKQHHADVEWVKSKHGNFFHRMVEKGFPTRINRWCCEEYKEGCSPRGAVLILGVRAEESPRRAAIWKPVTFHTRTRAWAVAPILMWKHGDVWQFIRDRGLPYCKLYDEGWKRLGCIGCPFCGERERESSPPGRGLRPTGGWHFTESGTSVVARCSVMVVRGSEMPISTTQMRCSHGGAATIRCRAGWMTTARSHAR